MLVKFNKIKIEKYRTIELDYADLIIYPNIYVRLIIPEQWISQIHSLLDLSLQTLTANNKKKKKKSKG